MMERKDVLIAVGVTVGAAVLVLFMKKGASSGASSGGGTGSQDIQGGFTSASTVYVPTSSYNIAYNNNKGTISYSTVDNISTTSYSNSPIHMPTPPPPPPIIVTSGGHTNPPTKQTGTTPTAPAAAHPAPSQSHPAWGGALIGGMHYATPQGGWNPNSVVDNLKEHGYKADIQSRAKVAAAMQLPGYTGTAAQNTILLNQLKMHGY